MVRGGPDREQRPGDVRRRRLAGVVADRQPLAVGGEDDFCRDHEARQAERVHLRAGNRRSARLGRTEDLVDRNTEPRRPHAVESLRQLSGGAAGSVGLTGLCVVDHLPRVEVPRNLDGRAKQERGRQREVAGCDHADVLLARQLVDLVVVRRRQAARADDDVDAPLDRGEDVLPDRGGVRVVDEDVHAGRLERLDDR